MGNQILGGPLLLSPGRDSVGIKLKLKMKIFVPSGLINTKVLSGA